MIEYSFTSIFIYFSCFSGPLRARLCLERNSTACGPYVVGVMVDTLDLAQPWLVALIVVVTQITLIGLLILIKCFYKSHNSDIKQVSIRCIRS